MQLLHEEVYAEGVHQVDEEAGIIRSVKVLGRHSANGRTYSRKAMEEAAKLYDGVDVNLDHRLRKESGTDKLADQRLFGELRNPRVQQEGVYADLHYLTKHPMASQIAEMAQKFSRKFGMSHDADGSLKRRVGQPDMVESVSRVESVDVVRRPATNAGLFEEVETTMKKTTLKALLEKHRADKRAKGLLKLLEQDEFAMMADAPVELPAEVSDAADEAATSVKEALRGMIIAVFDDESLDLAATKAAIGKILTMGEAIQKPAEETTGDGGDEAEEEEATESVSADALARIERRMDLRDLVEELGFTWASLSADQRKILAKQPDLESARQIAESFEKPASPKQKPAMRSVRESQAGGSKGSYDELKESIGRTRKGNRWKTGERQYTGRS